MSTAKRRCRFIAAICIVAILLPAATISVAAQYNYTTLTVPGASGTWASGISGANIVGWESKTNIQGFLYNINSNTYTILNAPGAVSTYAYGISGSNVVGSYFDGTNNFGFLYNINSRAYTVLSDPASPKVTLALGIDGTNIVGQYQESADSFGAFVYSGGQYTPLDVPDTQDAAANGISGTNIVGGFLDEDGLNEGFLFKGSTFIPLNVPGATYTEAYGIDGTNVVGDYFNNNPGDQGFLYNINSGVYTTVSVAGGTSTVAQGISGNNIVGFYTTADGGTSGFLATPVLTLQGADVAGHFQLTVSGPAVPVILQASTTNLFNWVSIDTNTPPFTYTDPAPTTFPSRFYRARLLQPF